MKNVACSGCGTSFKKRAGCANRAAAAGRPLYCSHACFAAVKAAARTTPKYGTPGYRDWKATYDRARHLDPETHARRLAQKRAAYHERVAREPEAVRAEQRAHRASRVEEHNAYCRRPEYVDKKRDYDIGYRARKDFGEEWAPVALVLREIDREVDERTTFTERAIDKNNLNKKQTRRRRHDQETSI